MCYIKKCAVLFLIILLVTLSFSCAQQPRDNEQTDIPDEQHDPATDEETVQKGAINKDILALVGISNKTLKNILGEECYAHLENGGIPIVTYSGFDVAYPFAFCLDNGGDWETAQQQLVSIGGAGVGKNPFSDEWPVYSFTISESQAHMLFGYTGPISYENLNRLFEQEPEIIYVPASGDNVMDPYDEYYYAEYMYDGVLVKITFDIVDEAYQLTYIFVSAGK